MRVSRNLAVFALVGALLVPASATAQTSLTADTWFNFTWNDIGPISEQFTATTSSLWVTDGFVVGDMFKVFAEGSEVGTTSTVAFDDGTDTEATTGADAWADSRLSSGIFSVNPGDLITIEVIQRAEGFSGGGAFIQSRSSVVPEPGAMVLTLSGLAGLAFVGIRRRKEKEI